MTIGELLVKVKTEKPNSFQDGKLIDYVNEIESDVCDQLNETFTPYTDQTQELMVPAPYDRLYVSWLKAKIDYANEEYASYQNNAVQHTSDFADFVDWVVSRKKEKESTFPSVFRNIW